MYITNKMERFNFKSGRAVRVAKLTNKTGLCTDTCKEAAREVYENNPEKKWEAARKTNSKYKRIVIHTFHMQVSLSSNEHEKLKKLINLTIPEKTT